MSNTKTIAKNTGWFGIESAIDALLTVVTSIAIARTLGPTKMGYLIYVTWIASVVSGLGALGLPATTRKYMAEFLGKGDKGTARFIYIRTFLLQVGFASLATLGLVIWVLKDSEPDYRVASLLVVLSIWPSMVNLISSQANVAAEDMAKNLPASAISILCRRHWHDSLLPLGCDRGRRLHVCHALYRLHRASRTNHASHYEVELRAPAA